MANYLIYQAYGNPDILNGDYDIHWLERFLAEEEAGWSRSRR